MSASCRSTIVCADAGAPSPDASSSAAAQPKPPQIGAQRRLDAKRRLTLWRALIGWVSLGLLILSIACGAATRIRDRERIDKGVRWSMNTARRPADIARQSAKLIAERQGRDAFRRETFALPREAAREKAREMLRRFPKAAYQTEIESWRVLPGDRIEFTVRRLPSAD